MTLVVSILGGFPIGLWLAFRMRALLTFGIIWTLVLVLQTVDIAVDPGAPNSGAQRTVIYWVAQPAIYGLGVALLWVGARTRARRRRRDFA